MKDYKKITHCIFDMDGLLLNTEQIYTKITQQILDNHGDGQRFTLDFKVSLMGSKIQDMAARVIKQYNLPFTTDEYIEIHESHAKEMMPTAELLPGVERLIRHLHAEKIPIALATGSSKSGFDLKTMRHTPLFDLFWHHVYGSSDPEGIISYYNKKKLVILKKILKFIYSCYW